MEENNLQMKTPFGITFAQDFVKEDMSELKKIKTNSSISPKIIFEISKELWLLLVAFLTIISAFTIYLFLPIE